MKERENICSCQNEAFVFFSFSHSNFIDAHTFIVTFTKRRANWHERYCVHSDSSWFCKERKKVNFYTEKSRQTNKNVVVQEKTSRILLLCRLRGRNSTCDQKHTFRIWIFRIPWIGKSFNWGYCRRNTRNLHTMHTLIRKVAAIIRSSDEFRVCFPNIFFNFSIWHRVHMANVFK